MLRQEQDMHNVHCIVVGHTAHGKGIFKEKKMLKCYPTFNLYISFLENVTMQSPVRILEKDPTGTFKGMRGESLS